MNKLKEENKYKTKNSVRDIVLIALLVAQAIVLSAIERLIPLPTTIPGAKLGLANIITLTAIYLFPFKEAFSVVLLKTIMTAFVLGSFSTFLYSFSGAVLSFAVMFIMYFILKDKISTIGISVAGAIAHNLGQLLMAAFIIKNLNILLYLPFLMVSGVATGIIVGLTTNLLLKYLKKTKLFKVK
ncbi:Gx transporter family protein [Clostridium grantii]|uniref:Heptaprenyl diphosphate synthase n=1 Tax=Clostridium grantii DSM 8605 TaxID=1121316 RepID=A0A1M5QG33_9CLOT|nr:Gx transporter family protein [Clostridium grantii]SHH13194.1 heptaprenyl diphosphate synthase [Clostridium grantii DSM 8605]